MPFDTEDFEKLTVDYGYRKNDLPLLSASDWSFTQNAENTNYFIEDRKTNTVHVFFDVEKGCSQALFYIPKASVNNIPCMILKGGVWSASVLSVKADGNGSTVSCPYARRDGTERIVGTFS